MGKLVNSYTCMDCGVTNEFPPDAFTHWDIPVPHTCDCGTTYTILQGVVYVLPTSMYADLGDE